MNIRQTILDRIDELGMSKYQLAQALQTKGVCQPSTVYLFLQGKQDTSSKIVAAVFEHLGLTITEA